VIGNYRRFLFTPAWRAHDAALDWLKRNPAILWRRPRLTGHTSGQGASDHAAVRPFEIDAGEAQCLLEAALIRYLVVDNLEEYEYTRRYAAAVVRALPERWHPVYASPDMTSRVYRRVGSADAPPR
jgi:hypothetical protein